MLCTVWNTLSETVPYLYVWFTLNAWKRNFFYLNCKKIVEVWKLSVHHYVKIRLFVNDHVDRGNWRTPPDRAILSDNSTNLWTAPFEVLLPHGESFFFELLVGACPFMGPNRESWIHLWYSAWITYWSETVLYFIRQCIRSDLIVLLIQNQSNQRSEIHSQSIV